MDSALGKRKERETDTESNVLHGSTLFVSNLPFTATSIDLQTLFSDIAPVRSAFVVTEHGTGVSKGVGYVSFAIKEDAETAFGNITKDGIKLAGRKLRIQWAEQKPAGGREKTELPKKAQKTRPPQRPQPPHIPHDPLATRTIVISGLPPSIDSKVLWKKIRKYVGAENVDWPMKDENGTEDRTTACVLFSNSVKANDAVEKLHAHVYKGSLLSVTIKKRLDTLAKPLVKHVGEGNKQPDNVQPKTAPSRASRLIVRNLPFNASEQDLRAVFLPYGPIYSVHIPTAEDTGEKTNETEDATESPKTPKKVRTKGFAFVWMLSKKDAEKAIEGCNGMVVRAGTANAIVADKQKRKKQKRLEKKMKGGPVQEVGVAEAEGEAQELDEKAKAATERVIAVDWALSKEKWKEEKAKLIEEMNVGDVILDDEQGGNDGGMSNSTNDASDTDTDDSDEDGLGFHQHGEGSLVDASEVDVEDGGDDEERGAPIKPQLPPPEEGTTLFVRNVPFNATEDEFRALFRAFGPLRYARITVDHATDRSRGTGFACYWNKEDADKVVEQSELVRVESTGVSILSKENPFKLPSILAPDPSSSLAQTLVLHGRTLDVVRAVPRDEAGKLREAGEKAREKADKRNLYLLREGVILPNSPAAENLTPVEIEKRTSSFNARRALLKSNPSLFVSKTRLSVRQIPTFVTERMLKRLALHATRTFEDEVKQGTRTGLTEDEKSEMIIEKDDELEANEKNQLRKKFNSKRTNVKQAKIVRIAERVDPITNKGRSKGYGFIEMGKHSDALRVLRWANNNSDVGPLFEQWWKDELADLLKLEKGKKEGKDDARLKRISDELESGGSRKSKGALIVEFSIENVQVVQRRSATSKEQPSTHETTKRSRDTHMGSKSEEQPPSKRRKSEPKVEEKSTSVEDKVTAARSSLGSIIGRKRKERKGRKKGAS